MKKVVCSGIAAVVFLVYAGMANAANLKALSVWQNQSGSTFSIDAYDPSNGLFSGTYINRAAGTGCQNTPYAVTGYILADMISWSVKWANVYANCNSVTGWTGYYNKGTITTNWNLAYMASSGGYVIEKGGDTFKRVAQKMEKFLMK